MDTAPHISYTKYCPSSSQQARKYGISKTSIPWKIQKRYKRFLADVTLENGELITAHTPNTGSMKTCWEKDCQFFLVSQMIQKKAKIYSRNDK